MKNTETLELLKQSLKEANDLVYHLQQENLSKSNEILTMQFRINQLEKELEKPRKVYRLKI
jgi:hypothetical protein